MLALYVWLKNWLASDEGQDLIEYALIIGLLVVVAVLGLAALGRQINTLWDTIRSWLVAVGTGI